MDTISLMIQSEEDPAREKILYGKKGNQFKFVFILLKIKLISFFLSFPWKKVLPFRFSFLNSVWYKKRKYFHRCCVRKKERKKWRKHEKIKINRRREKVTPRKTHLCSFFVSAELRFNVFRLSRFAFSFLSVRLLFCLLWCRNILHKKFLKAFAHYVNDVSFHQSYLKHSKFLQLPLEWLHLFIHFWVLNG